MANSLRAGPAIHPERDLRIARAGTPLSGDGRSASLPVQDIPVSRLLLDKENPRLASGAGADSQKELLKLLWDEMAVDEVALSIAANGYFKEEPLFAIPHDPKETVEGKKRYVVVEGNRRLAAVLLLRDESLRKAVGATDLPRLTQSQNDVLDVLPVTIYHKREQLWRRLGFRHINGQKPWDAYSKAKYVASVFEKHHVALKDIANSIGDRHSTVVRLYRGLKLLDQAEQMAAFRREDVIRNRFYFSHLYTAADQPDFQKFLGITAQNSLRANPVPKAKLGALRELVVWLYGSKSERKEPLVRTQNPDLNTLREVISSSPSLAALRSGYSLERAHEISVGDARRFREALTRAKEDLQQAKATVTTGYSGERDLYAMMEEILLVAGTLHREMSGKRAP